MARVTPQLNAVDEIQPPHRRMFMPTNTMVEAPSIPSPAAFGQFANALAQINPKIQGFLAGQEDQYQQTQADQGKAQAIKAGVTYQEAIKRGIINENQSPFFMQAWKEIDGANLGDQINAQVQEKYATDPIRNSTDPAQVQQWTQQQVQQLTQNVTDPAMLRGLAPKLDQLHRSITAQGVQDAKQNAVYGMTNAVGTQVGNIVDQYVGETKQSGQPFNADELAGRINSFMALPKFAAMDPKLADETVAQTVIDKAKQYGDKDILAALNSSRPDSRNPGQVVPGIGKIARYQAASVEASKAIDVMNWQAQAHQYTVEEHNITEAKRTLGGEVMTALAHGQQPDQAKVDAWLKVDPGAAEQMQSFQIAHNKLAQGTPMLPQQYATVQANVMSIDANGATRTSRLQKLAAAGQFPGTVQQFTQMYADAEKLDASGIDHIRAVSDIYNSITHGDLSMLGIGVKSPIQDPNKQAMAGEQFLEQARVLLQQNQNTDPDALRPQLMKIRDEVVKEFSPNEDDSEQGSKPAQSTPSESTASKPKEPLVTPSGDAPSQFSVPATDDVTKLQKNPTNAAIRAWFIGKYGDRAYRKALSAGIR